jgi:hypothetical protein
MSAVMAIFHSFLLSDFIDTLISLLTAFVLCDHCGAMVSWQFRQRGKKPAGATAG